MYKKTIVLIVILLIILSVVIFLKNSNNPIINTISNALRSIFHGKKHATVTSYSSNLNITKVENLLQLKTTTFMTDYIFIANEKDANGKSNDYIAVYPFTVEAGFDLSKIKYNNDNTVEATPEILNVVPSDAEVFVDDIKGYSSDYYKNSLITGLEKHVKKMAIENGIYNKVKEAEKDLIELIPTLTNAKIKINLPKNSIVTYSSDKYPIEFKVDKVFSNNYRFSHSGKYFTNFIDKNSGKSIGSFYYSNQFGGTSLQLLDKLESQYKGPITYKIINPNDPDNINYALKIYNNRIFGYTLNDGNLIFSECKVNDAEEFKSQVGNYVYLILSMKAKKNGINYSKVNDYKDFINLLISANKDIEIENLGGLKSQLNCINQLGDDYSNYAKKFGILYNLVKNHIYTTHFEDDNLDLLGKVYNYIDTDDSRIYQIKDDFSSWLYKNRNIINDFEPYLNVNYNIHWFDNDELNNLKISFQDYLFLQNSSYKIDEKERENAIENLISKGVFINKLWNSISDTQRKKYLKRMYINIVMNKGNIEEHTKKKYLLFGKETYTQANYFYYFDNYGNIKRADLYNETGFNLSKILYDYASIENKDSIKYKELADDIYDYFSKNPSDLTKLQDKVPYNVIMELRNRDETNKIVDENFTLVLGNRNKITRALNNDIFIFLKDGLLWFSKTKNIFNVPKFEYKGFVPYTNAIEVINHANLSFNRILKLFENDNNTNNNSEKEYVLKEIQKLIRFIIRDKTNVFTLN